MAKKKGKLPWFKFFPNDWARDLEEHPLEIEGAWIRICCKLWWEESRGKGSKTLTQWAKVLRTTDAEALFILRYISDEKLGGVSANLTEPNVKPNGIITVTSRRMLNDEKDRQDNARRQRKHYARHKPNGNITDTLQESSDYSQKSESESESDMPLTEAYKKENARAINWHIQAVFDAWQTTTIDHEKMVSHETLTDDIRAAIAKAVSEHTDPAKIIKAVENYAAVLQGDEYRWSHAWPLELFLERGLSRFLDEAKPLKNYHAKNTGGNDGNNPKDIGRSFAGAKDDSDKFDHQ